MFDILVFVAHLIKRWTSNLMFMSSIPRWGNYFQFCKVFMHFYCCFVFKILKNASKCHGLDPVCSVRTGLNYKKKQHLLSGSYRKKVQSNKSDILGLFIYCKQRIMGSNPTQGNYFEFLQVLDNFQDILNAKKRPKRNKTWGLDPVCSVRTRPNYNKNQRLLTGSYRKNVQGI